MPGMSLAAARALSSALVVTLPAENSDITANAQEGAGGSIEINFPNIFGISDLTREQLAANLPPDSTLDPRLLNTSDITAISEAGSQLSGQVIFTASGVNPAQGLVELPQNIVDPATLIAANPCIQGETSVFIVTGRGGLPSSPGEPLSDNGARVGWSELPSVSPSLSQNQSGGSIATETSGAIAPAQGWVMNDKGEVTLVAYHTDNNTSRRNPSPDLACPGR